MQICVKDPNRLWLGFPDPFLQQSLYVLNIIELSHIVNQIVYQIFFNE